MDQNPSLHMRGYLPHLELAGTTQYVTFRLDDALPMEVYSRWRDELCHLSDRDRMRELYRRCERFLDAGHGSCIFKNPAAARIVQESLFEYSRTHYDLHYWVVMSNHAHIMITPFGGVSLSDAMQRIKGASSKRIHEKLGGRGRLWQPESFDRLVRNDDMRDRVAHYIHWNPVKAKLCKQPEDWPYSSANRVAVDLYKQAKACGPNAG